MKEITKRYILGKDRKKSVFLYLFSGFSLIFGMLAIVMIPINWEWKPTFVGNLFQILMFLFFGIGLFALGVILICMHLKYKKSVKESMNNPWKYRVFQCISTEFIPVSEEDMPDELWLTLKDGDYNGRIKVTTSNKNKVVPGDKIIVVATDKNVVDKPVAALGLWFFVGDKYYINEYNPEFVYENRLRPVDWDGR